MVEFKGDAVHLTITPKEYNALIGIIKTYCEEVDNDNSPLTHFTDSEENYSVLKSIGFITDEDLWNLKEFKRIKEVLSARFGDEFDT